MVEENQVQTETNEYFKKVDSEIGLDKDDAYSDGKHSKIGDFFIGFGMSYGISVAIGIVIMGIFSLINFLSGSIMPNVFAMFFGMGLMPTVVIPFVLPLIIALILANKKFPGRRLIKVGAWTAFLLPIIAFLILLGACFISLGNI